MNPDLRPCWRCKKPFNPEASEFWPNIKETCPACVRVVLPTTSQVLTRPVYGRGTYSANDIPDRLLADVVADPVSQAEAILRGRV